MTLSERTLGDSSLIIDDESPFSFEELFFSRTDERGVIKSGNSVFQRVSHYSWETLLNAPHRVIRHPDMPKAVFWLLWDTIKKGKPIGAYVKNRAKDGRYYWVYAVVTPIEGGYLSVRLKPSSSLFEIVAREYEALRDLERDQNLEAEDSAKLLLIRLNELGFRDYAAFQAASIGQEITARNEKLGRDSDSRISYFNRLEKSAETLLERTAEIFKVYMGSEYVPLNLRVQATQLGKAGAPMCVISNNYTSISLELQDDMQRFIDAGMQVAQTIDEGLFLLATSKIQQEASETFENEVSETGSLHDQELHLLENQRSNYSEKAAKGLKDTAYQIKQFAQACMAMKRLTTSLEVTRVMGKIENASLDASITTLDDLIDDLGDFQKALMEGLKEIDYANRAMETDIKELLKAS